jgi:hypothetical protein
MQRGALHATPSECSTDDDYCIRNTLDTSRVRVSVFWHYLQLRWITSVTDTKSRLVF